MITYTVQTFRSERGAVVIEYAIGLTVLVMVFAVASVGLLIAGTSRQNESIGTVQSVAPCSDRMKLLYNGSADPDVTTKALCD